MSGTTPTTLRDRIERHSTLINIAMVVIAVGLVFVFAALGLPRWLSVILGIRAAPPATGLVVAAVAIGSSFLGQRPR